MQTTPGPWVRHRGAAGTPAAGDPVRPCPHPGPDQESLDLLLIPGQQLRKGLQLLQHLLILRTSPVIEDIHSGEAVIPAHIQKLQIDVPALRLSQLHQGIGAALPTILCDAPAPILCDSLENGFYLSVVQF